MVHNSLGVDKVFVGSYSSFDSVYNTFTKHGVFQGLAFLVPRTLNTEIVASKCQVPVGIKAYCDVRKGFKNSYICSHKCFSVENLSFKLH